MRWTISLTLSAQRLKMQNVMVKIDSIVSTSTTKWNFHVILMKTLQKKIRIENIWKSAFYRILQNENDRFLTPWS